MLEDKGHERRVHRRVPKRLSVRYGEHGLDRSSFTRNVSMGGLHVVGESGARNGRLHLQVFLTPEHFVLVEAAICWEKQVPSALKTVVPAGFGVRFLATGDLLAATIADIGPGDGIPAARDASDEVITASLRPDAAPRPSGQGLALRRALPQPLKAASDPGLITPAPARATPAPVPEPRGRPPAPAASQIATGRPDAPFVIEARSRDEALRVRDDVARGRVGVSSPVALPPGAEVHVELRFAYDGAVGAVRAVGRVMSPEPGLRLRMLRVQLSDAAAVAAGFAALIK